MCWRAEARERQSFRTTRSGAVWKIHARGRRKSACLQPERCFCWPITCTTTNRFALQCRGGRKATPLALRAEIGRQNSDRFEMVPLLQLSRNPRGVRLTVQEGPSREMDQKFAGRIESKNWTHSRNDYALQTIRKKWTAGVPALPWHDVLRRGLARLGSRQIERMNLERSVTFSQRPRQFHLHRGVRAFRQVRDPDITVADFR